ncbi:DUF2157 domain-containing protein [Kangiella sp. HD9-110m-PIT-SAG07]|nr:DUF2157 domain-containing protein [Kangiella sp. HD9-110m-PIT-SAG07]
MNFKNSRKTVSPDQLKWLESESELWKEDGLIQQDTRDKLLDRYQKAETPQATNQNYSWGNILLISLGSLLIGGGVILLLAHNWESFGKGARTFLSFLPLVLAQGLCWYGIQRKPNSIALRESSAVLLFFAVAACIALISQTYHIYGELERFLVVWLLLTLPVVYLLRSATVLMLISGIILWLCCLEREPYWLFYVALTPYLYKLYQRQSRLLLHWSLWIALFSLTISVVYGSSYYTSPLDNWAIYITLAMGCAFYALGYWLFGLEHDKFWSNAPTSLGILIIGFISLMFTWYGRTLPYDLWQVESPMGFNEYSILTLFVGTLVFTALFIARRYTQFSVSHWVALSSFAFVLLGLVGFFFRFNESVFVILSNLYILIGSVLLMFQGINRNKLMLLNGGLVWFSLLVLFRFFDSDIPFMYKGIIFIVIGSAFIATNIWFKKKQQAKSIGGEA